MKRNSLDVEGCVQFPISSMPAFGGNGTLVKLWVIDRQDFSEAYGVCSGVAVYDQCTEEFMGSDKARWPNTDDVYAGAQTEEDFQRGHRTKSEMLRRFSEQFFIGESQEQSVPLLASIVLGSTGWSHSSFICTYEHLTPEGKAIYDAMGKLYPRAELHLMTFMDT